MKPVQCKKIRLCTLYDVLCSKNSLQCIVLKVKCTIYCVSSTKYSVQFIVFKYSVNYTADTNERGELAVNFDKEANWLSIERKRQLGCKFK